MKIRIFCCLCLLQVLNPLSARVYPAQKPRSNGNTYTTTRNQDREWRAATYKGLKLGQSTLRDMFRALGRPTLSEQFGDSKSVQEVWYHYAAASDLPGTVVVVVKRRTGRIKRIDLYPAAALSKEDAIKFFGVGYITVTYDFDNCLGDDESAPLYESSSGSIKNIEYRQRGIAIAVSYSDKVNQISFVSSPVGAASSKCKEGSKASLSASRRVRQ
jgi:hypothetical protein